MRSVTPVFESGLHRFFRGTCQALAGATTKIFAKTIAPAGQVTGFYIDRIDIRNNGGQSLWIGWVKGQATRGAAISTITAVASKVLITSVAHGLENGTEIIIAGQATSAATHNLRAQGKFFVINKTADDFNIAITAGGTAIASTSGADGTTGAYWYAGYEQGVPPVQNDAGQLLRKGMLVETSSIPNDFIRIPVGEVEALFIYNSHASTALTNTDGLNDAYLWG